MKASSSALRTHLQNSVTVKALPKLRAEWEHNRFTPIQSLAVTPSQNVVDEWAEIYDLESVGLPNRPGTGVAKARLNEGLMARIGYRDKPTESRFYLSGPDDPYQYFASVQKTGTTLASGSYAFAEPIRVSLVYEADAFSNKLVVGFERSYAAPISFTVEVTFNGTTWNTVATNPTLNSEGRVELWRQSSGQWTGTPNYENATAYRGIRVTVNSMSRPNAHLDLIQLGLRLEQDLSDVVESYSKGFEVSDRSKIAPMGKASANQADVVLSNIDQRFNNDNVESVYRGLIGKKVKFTMDLSYDCTPTGGSADERIRAFTMWTEDWSSTDQSSVTVPLKDSSVFLQEIDVPKVYWEDQTIGAIVWQVMDAVGFTNYNYSTSVLDTGQIVPYFWPEEGATVWEQFSILVEGTQTAIYFDEYDVLQIKTRNSAMGGADTVVWGFDADQNGPKLADLANLTTQTEEVANSVTINYQPASYSDFNNGMPKMEVVWEPEEETMTLRSTPLSRDLLIAHTSMYISPTVVVSWPYESLVNIGGEVLRYNGKEYQWYKPGVGPTKQFIKSAEEKKRLDDASNQSFMYTNTFTGRLKITERGVFGSGVADHRVREEIYSSIMTNHVDSRYGFNGLVRKDGYLQASTITGSAPKSVMLARHPNTVTPSNSGGVQRATFGCRIRFPETGHTAAGLWFDGGSIESGYYLELQTTEYADKVAARATRHEVSLASCRETGQGLKIIPSETDPKGARAAIVRNTWYTLEVQFEKSSSYEYVTVFLNGVRYTRFEVPAANRPVSVLNRFGVYSRWTTTAHFEYLYGFGNAPSTAPDTSTFLDLRAGAFTSGYAERDWKYRTFVIRPVYRRRSFPQTISRSNYVFDEFGPIVHEVREITAEFDASKVPVQHSFLYITNTAQVAVIDYHSTPFGAKFLIANASRKNAVAKGEDTITFGEDNSVNQSLFVYGRSLYQEDSVTIQKDDEASIRKNGKISLTFENKMIQTKQAAEDLAEWVVRLWKVGSEEVTIEVFGNPLVQVGDLVSISYPSMKMAHATHKYYVVAINENFDTGLSTTLTLRRARSLTAV